MRQRYAVRPNGNLVDRAPTARLNSFFPWLEDVLEDDDINHLCGAAEHHLALCYEWETDLKLTLQEFLDYFRPSANKTG